VEMPFYLLTRLGFFPQGFSRTAAHSISLLE
jgi:hypothetical protein